MTLVATPASKRDAVVGIGELRISNIASDRLVTFALGSCLGITVHDPVAGVGGMLHAMLPESASDPVRAQAQAATFVDTGVPALFKACYAFGAKKERMVVKVAGGARIGESGGADCFEIGRRNLLMLRKLLWKNNVLIAAEDVGGQQSRTMALDIASGLVTLKVGGIDRVL